MGSVTGGDANIGATYQKLLYTHKSWCTSPCTPSFDTITAFAYVAYCVYKIDLRDNNLQIAWLRWTCPVALDPVMV